MKPTDWADDTSRRTRQQHLSGDEIAQIKQACRSGIRVRATAEKFGCSMRIVQKYYAEVRGRVREYARPEPSRRIERPKKKVTVNRTARFYHSDFEPH